MTQLDLMLGGGYEYAQLYIHYSLTSVRRDQTQVSRNGMHKMILAMKSVDKVHF